MLEGKIAALYQVDKLSYHKVTYWEQSVQSAFIEEVITTLPELFFELLLEQINFWFSLVFSLEPHW